jgi:hypothetical protein
MIVGPQPIGLLGDRDLINDEQTYADRHDSFPDLYFYSPALAASWSLRNDRRWVL